MPNVCFFDEYQIQTIIDADYADDLVLLANVPAQDKPLLHNLEQTTSGIVLYVRWDKTEFMYNKDGAISSSNNKPPKLVDQFIYLSSNISSTESDANISKGKVWAAIERLMTI